MEMSSYDIIQIIHDELKKEQEDNLLALRKIKSEIDEVDVSCDSIAEKRIRKESLLITFKEIEDNIHLVENRMQQLENVLSDSSMLHVKQLSILDAQEKERQRIARDLHDTSLQNLTHLIHKIELCSLYIDKDPVHAKLELATVEKGIRGVIDEIRSTIFNLRPMSFDDLGFRETIERLLIVLNMEQKFQIVSDIDEVYFSSSDNSMCILLISICRIIQECVQNSIKHSDGNKIIVRLKNYDNMYLICIHDNGKGFDWNEAIKKDKHFGLSVIKERVSILEGKIKIDTADGTSIEIIIPKCH